MSYRLHLDQKYWQEATYDEEMKCVDVRTTDIVNDGSDGYYWITSSDREEVLAVDNFMEAEEIIIQLRKEEIEDLEHAEMEYPDVAEVKAERPPY